MEKEKIEKQKFFLKYENQNKLFIIKNRKKIISNTFFRIYFLLCLIMPIFSSNKKHDIRKLQTVQKIIIKVSESGEQEIIGTSFSNKPTSIFINGEVVTLENNKINVPEGQNEITLQWDNAFSYCEKMFSGLENIIEIDFSEFDTHTSNMNMKCLLENYKKLKKIKFDNTETTVLIGSMYNMFVNCSSLESLDLSKFDTSQITEMQNLFSNCYYLSSLDISNFDTALVTDMSNFLCNCSSLTSINLLSLNTQKVTNMKNIIRFKTF